MSGARLLITSVPPGEAPLWVREQWVGVSMPLAQRRPDALLFLTSGVLSGPRSFLSRVGALLTGKLKPASGFRVEARSAIDALAVAHPDAAAWWRTNAPHLIDSKRFFVFPRSAGHVIKEQSGA